MPPSGQRIKTIYFPLAATERAKTGRARYGRAVAMAFNPGSEEQMATWEFVRPLSSEQLRELVGIASFDDLVARAERPTRLGVWLRERLGALRERSAGRGRLGSAARRVLAQAETQRKAPEDESVSPFRGLAPGIEDSPALARHLIERHAPRARAMLDPFAGSGGLLIAAGQRGIHARGCEIDPVFRLVAGVKIDALARVEEGRLALGREISVAASSVYRITTDVEPLAEHRASFRAAFGGKGARIAGEALERVLAARAWVEACRLENPLLARCVEASLLAAAARHGRGDAGGAADAVALQERLQEELTELGRFVSGEPSLREIPSLVAHDARELAFLPPLGVDLVFTVPPTRASIDASPRSLERWFAGAAADPSRSRGLPASSRAADSERPLLPSMERDCREVERHRGGAIAAKVRTHYRLIASVLRLAAVHAAKRASIIAEIEDDFVEPVRIDVAARVGELLALEGFDLKERVVRRVRRSTRHAVTIERNVVVFRR